jgi:uncharacterized protein
MNTPLIRAGWLRVTVFAICFLLVFIIASSLYYSVKGWLALSDEAFFLGSFILSFSFFMLTVYIFRRVVDRNSFKSLGFQFKGFERDIAIGLLLGIVLLGVESLILYFTGHLAWMEVHLHAVDLLSGLLLMILVAISEETVFRGYILNNLMQSMNKWVALGITALLFAVFHAGNPGITALALFNIFLSGLLMGLNYLYTKNLWFAIFFHFSWNFFLGPVLGYEVSGLPLNSLLEQNIEGPDWLTGGIFGLEGSILDGIFSVIAFAMLMAYYEKGERPCSFPENV